MATQSLVYSSNTSITFSLASIATSATFVAGAESAQIDNTSNLYIDAIVRGQVTVGTTPTVNTNILVYVWGAHTSLGTTALDVLDGTDSTETLTSVGVRNGMLALAAVLDVDATTSNRVYYAKPFSVAQALGLQTLPKFWGLFLTHNTGVNLNSTGGNHVWEYVGVKYESA
jgi:hypothetical protein